MQHRPRLCRVLDGQHAVQWWSDSNTGGAAAWRIQARPPRGGEVRARGPAVFQISNLASVFAVFQISGLAATLQEP